MFVKIDEALVQSENIAFITYNEVKELFIRFKSGLTVRIEKDTIDSIKQKLLISDKFITLTDSLGYGEVIINVQCINRIASFEHLGEQVTKVDTVLIYFYVTETVDEILEHLEFLDL